MSTPNDPQTPPAAPPATPPAAPPANPPAAPATPPAPSADDQLLAARQETLAAKSNAAALQKQLDEAKRNGLKTSEDWKGLSEAEKTRADNAEAENVRIKKALVDDKKYSELKTEAVKQGINPLSLNDLDLLDFPNVVAETGSNGRVNVVGAQQAITKLKAERPNWFQGAAPNLNPGTPQGGDMPPNGSVTLADLTAAQAKYLASKSDADLAAYNNLVIKYKQGGGI